MFFFNFQHKESFFFLKNDHSVYSEQKNMFSSVGERLRSDEILMKYSLLAGSHHEYHTSAFLLGDRDRSGFFSLSSRWSLTQKDHFVQPEEVSDDKRKIYCVSFTSMKLKKECLRHLHRENLSSIFDILFNFCLSRDSLWNISKLIRIYAWNSKRILISFITVKCACLTLNVIQQKMISHND